MLGPFLLTEIMNKRLLYKIFNDKYNILDFNISDDIDFDIIKGYFADNYEKQNELLKLTFLESSEEEFSFEIEEMITGDGGFHGIVLNFEEEEEILQEEYIEDKHVDDESFGKMVLGQNIDYSKIKLQLTKPKIITSGNYLLKKLKRMPPLELIYCSLMIRRDTIQHHILEEDYLFNILLYKYLDKNAVGELELMIYYGLLFHLINTIMVTRAHKFHNNYTLKTRGSEIYLLKLRKMNIDKVRNPLMDDRNNAYKANIVRTTIKEKIKTLLLINWKNKLLIKNKRTLNYLLLRIAEDNEVLEEEW
jgi:hypothetical protein